MFKHLLFLIVLGTAVLSNITAQKVSGVVKDGQTKEVLIGASVLIDGTTKGTITDYDGFFEIAVDDFPATLVISYLGFLEQRVEVSTAGEIDIELKKDDGLLLDVIEVKGQRIAEKQKAAPLTVESMDLLAIKETPSDNFYDGLGSLKGVDLTAASLGFKVINTRGFNSTSPVRSLQLIDGVDNQSPGLNFSLGNFLGAPELDVLSVELIQGASSAFYGPNAFNGVINITSKNPFYHEGLSASVKMGERNLLEGAVRWADVINNKQGLPVMAYKFNVAYFDAEDWEADNFSPVDGTDDDVNNPGGYDAVNIYGDEYNPGGDYTTAPLFSQWRGLQRYYRTGYRERDVVSYETDNIKLNAGIYFRLQPEKKEESLQLALGSSFAEGSTIYQGDNRFALRNIQFFQHRLDLSIPNKFFFRAYVTHEDAGDSYDPYFTSLQLQREATSNSQWFSDYQSFWTRFRSELLLENGYPDLVFPEPFDVEGAEQWLIDNRDLLAEWHADARAYADEKQGNSFGLPFYEPGTDRFDEAFNRIISSRRGEGGTLFIDRSALYHTHSEYTFSNSFFDEIKVGASARYYTPESEGTIFSDSVESITNFEYGVYGGLSKDLWDKKLRLSGSIRTDKNENFDRVYSPAFSAVYKPAANNYLRLSFSSAVRNPTLSDQYLYLDVGPARLLGNLEGAEGLNTLESISDFLESFNVGDLVEFDVAPIQPEKVRTFELGYRTTLWNSLYIDGGYYYSIYDDFIGFNIGGILGFTSGQLSSIDVRRYAANSSNEVRTQGTTIGFNYYFNNYFAINANHSWNKLVKTDEDDPIIPAFNTPEHKFNIGVSGRGIPLGSPNSLGFNVNYKWIQGFIFEGSPQFTGFVPTYDLLDAQVNYKFHRLKTILKVGASNLLNNERFQTYGGPRIGRLAYISATYEF